MVVLECIVDFKVNHLQKDKKMRGNFIQKIAINTSWPKIVINFKKKKQIGEDAIWLIN